MEAREPVSKKLDLRFGCWMFGKSSLEDGGNHKEKSQQN